MSEHDDEYLWSGQGTASEDVAALERELESLRWRPQALLLPVDPARAKWWPAVVGGLVAAAAVLALLSWPKPDAAVGEPAPVVNPTAPPTSPDVPDVPDMPDMRDLKDPFGPRDSGGSSNPDQVAPSVSPDLVNPFAGRTDSRARPEPKPRSSHDTSPDLKNPFGDRQPEEDRDGDLVDPFGDRKDPPRKTSPDLEDPFSR